MKNKDFERFDRMWKDHPYTTKGVKYVTQNFYRREEAVELLPPRKEDENYDNYHCRFFGATNELMKRVHRNYLDGNVSLAQLCSKGSGNPAGKLVKENADIFLKYGISLGIIEEQIAQKALQVLSSYVNRNERKKKKEKERKKKEEENRKKKGEEQTKKSVEAEKKRAEKREKKERSTPTLRPGRSLPFRRGTIKDSNPSGEAGFLTFRISKEEYVSIPYFIPGRFKDDKQWAQYKKNLGGNLVFRKGCAEIVVVINKPLPAWAYRPINVLGMDFNMGKKWLVSFEKDEPIPMPKEGERLVELLRKINREIKNSKARSNELCRRRREYEEGHDLYPKKEAGKEERERRQKLRLEWFKLHEKLKKEMRPIAEQIVEMAVSRRLVLAIDMVKTGEKNGTFGQEKLQELVVEICEARGVPFVMVPPQYTTIIHNNPESCFGIADRVKKANGRTDMNRCKCRKCGDEYVSHVNAAANGRYFGELIWKKGFQYFLRWRRGLLISNGIEQKEMKKPKYPRNPMTQRPWLKKDQKKKKKAVAVAA